MARTAGTPEPEFDGGAQPVHERPHDQPGPSRGPIYVLVAILGAVSLLVPVLWGIGALATVGRVIGGAALIGLWFVWGIVMLVFIWALASIWRRAA